MMTMSSTIATKSYIKPNNSGPATIPPTPAIIIEEQTPCQKWMNGKCVKGDECPFLHSWSTGETFSMLARLKRDNTIKGICGIALPFGSDKLYSSNSDGLVSVWDFHTGNLTETTNLAQPTTYLTGVGVWVFVGLRNSIKAINSWTKEAYTLGAEKPAAPFGFVYAIVTSGDMLLLEHRGSILAWKRNYDKVEPFKLVAVLTSHAKAVLCLAARMKRLYSGSSDRTIRVWDVDTFECLQVMEEHTDIVRSMICWDNYLISGSPDKKIKFWATTDQEGTIEVLYTHDVKSGVVSLCVIEEAKNSVLLCSCKDWCVRLYDLPSFEERGMIYGKDEVTRLVKAPGGLFFSGDFSGTVSVWKFAESSTSGKKQSAKLSIQRLTCLILKEKNKCGDLLNHRKVDSSHLPNQLPGVIEN